MGFDIERNDNAGVARLVVRGALDAQTGIELERALLRAELAQPARLELDLTGLDFMDSTGLGLVLDADVRAAAEGRRLVVLAGDGEARRVLDLVSLGDRLSAAELR
jgi:anti-anti-sigma factor